MQIHAIDALPHPEKLMKKYLSLILVPVALLTLAAKGDGCDNTALPSTDGGPGTCSSFDVKFDLTVGGSSPVYYWGANGSSGCAGSWLSVATADGNPLILDANACGIPCAAFWATAGSPVAAAPQSLSWDGTYYPLDDDGKCPAPACAASGNYIATFCVVDGAGDDAGFPEGTPSPTCKQVPFVWPPTSADTSVSATITPTPDGG
jgi:hypothetical protein